MPQLQRRHRGSRSELSPAAGDSTGLQAGCPGGSRSEPLAGGRLYARPQSTEPSRAGCCQTPLSPLPPGAPVSQNGFPPGTAASGRGLRGHGHPPSSNLVWLPSLGRPRGQRAGGSCPGSKGPVYPRALRTGPTFVREGGAGASLEPAHTHSTGCRGEAGSPQPPYLPGPSASVQGCRGGGLPAAGGAADGGQAESPAAPAPGVPSGASQGSGLRGEGVPTPLAGTEKGP